MSDIYYDGAKAYFATQNKSSYLSLMTAYDEEKAITVWHSIDAFVDLFVDWEEMKKPQS